MADASRSHIVDGRIVYTWSQTLDDVTVVVPDIPPAPARAFSVSIAPTRLTLGLAGNPPYLDVRGWWSGLEGALSWRAPRGEEDARAVGGQHPFFNSNGLDSPVFSSRSPPLPASSSSSTSRAASSPANRCGRWVSVVAGEKESEGQKKKQHATISTRLFFSSFRGRRPARLPHQSRPRRALARRLCLARARASGRSQPGRGAAAVGTVCRGARGL